MKSKGMTFAILPFGALLLVSALSGCLKRSASSPEADGTFSALTCTSAFTKAAKDDADIYLRTGPDAQPAIAEKLSGGRPVTVLGDGDKSWVYVSYVHTDGKTYVGYIFTRLLTCSADGVSSEVTATATATPSPNTSVPNVVPTVTERSPRNCLGALPDGFCPESYVACRVVPFNPGDKNHVTCWDNTDEGKSHGDVQAGECVCAGFERFLRGFGWAISPWYVRGQGQMDTQKKCAFESKNLKCGTREELPLY